MITSKLYYNKNEWEDNTNKYIIYYTFFGEEVAPKAIKVVIVGNKLFPQMIELSKYVS